MVCMWNKKVYIWHIYSFLMRKVEVDNVEAMVEKEVDKNGRLSGFIKYAGRKALVIILQE